MFETFIIRAVKKSDIYRTGDVYTFFVRGWGVMGALTKFYYENPDFRVINLPEITAIKKSGN